MKRIFLAILIVIFCTTSAFGAADPNANAKTQALLTYITNLSGTSNRILSGQLDGHAWFADGETGLCDAVAAKNPYKYPAIMGLLYVGFPGAFTTENNKAIAYSNNGGIVIVQPFWDNPKTGSWGGNLTTTELTQTITPGHAYNTAWNATLDSMATSLATLESNNVAVIFNAFTEMNGPDRWYYTTTANAAYFKALWVYTFNYLTTTKGLHNLLWLYAPGNDTNVTAFYPGADYVDITGFSYYDDNRDGTLASTAITRANAMIALGKPFGWSEYGVCPGNDTAGQCPPRAHQPMLTSFKNSVPATKYWLTWSGWFSMDTATDLPTLFGDAWTITRDEVSYYGTTSAALSLTKAGTGTGLVYSSPSGIYCGSTCTSQSYNFQSSPTQTQVTLYAEATTDHTFTGWSGSGCSGTGNCTVVMSAAKSVQATFAAPAASTTWYVDKDATCTPGSTCDGTSWDTAWKTFSAITWGTGGVQAGHTLYISGGTVSKTYTVATHGTLAPTASGTGESARIQIKVGQASPHNGQVIIDGGGTSAGISLAYRSWITVDGNVGGSRNLRVTNGAMFPWQSSIVYMPGVSSANKATGLRLSYLEIDKGCDGVNARYNKYLEIDNSYIHDIRGDAAIAATAGEGGWGDIKIHHNTIVTNKATGSGYGPDGITITYGGDIYNNTIYSTDGDVVGHSNIGTSHTLVYPDETDCSGITYCYQHCDLIQATGKRMRIYNNKFYYGGNSIYYRSTAETEVSDIWFYNNVFSQPGLWAIVLDYRNDATKPTTFARIYVLNNTFTDHSTHEWGTINSLVTDAAITDVQVKNNIFYNSGVDRAYNDRLSAGQCTSLYASSKVSNNVVHAGDHGEAGWQCNYSDYSSSCASCTFSTEPTFTDYTEYDTSSDLSLAEGDTAARGKGANLTTLLASAGLPRSDIVGTDRPTSGAWDVGAYQYTAGGSPDEEVPTAPTNLTATALSYPAVNLFWTASTDNVGVTGYRVYRCIGVSCTPSNQIATPSGTSYQDTGLLASTVYGYTVKAVDAAGNLSAAATTAYATTPAADVNIALNKTVTSSSEESGSYLDDYAVDGSLTTRWSADIAGYPDDPQWYKVDLGDSYEINKVMLRWEAAYATDYTVQYSTDDVDYTTAVTVTGGDGGTDTHTISPAVTARYIKINMTGHYTPYYYSLWEVEVYGTAASNYLQFENAGVCTLAGTMTATADELASGGYYISSAYDYTEPNAGTATCTFTVADAGTYKIVTRAYAGSSAADSFTIQVDALDASIYDMNPQADPAQYAAWYDDEVCYRGPSPYTYNNPQYDPYVVTLTAGEHTITFTNREKNARLDYFYLVPVQITEQFKLTYTKAGDGTGTVVINGINCSDSCEYNYNAGTPITITGTAGGSSTFAGWSGGLCTGTDACEFAMTEARAVTGTFTLNPPYHTLTIEKAGTGLGTVTSSPAGIDYGATAAFDFTEGTVVTLTATPMSGSTFAGWSGTGGCTGTSTHDITVSADKACTATFNLSDAPAAGKHSFGYDESPIGGVQGWGTKASRVGADHFWE